MDIITTQPIRELRREHSGAITYTAGTNEAGRATWLNISRKGAAIRLGRYLRPGRQLHLKVETASERSSILIPAEIAWCTPIAGTVQFRAGLNVLRSDPETALHFAILGHQARIQNKKYLNAVVDVVWPSFQETLRPLPNAEVTSFTAAR